MYLNQLRKPSAYLSCAILLWALFSISTGVSWSFDTVLISRFLLGFTEAVYTPGVYLMLSRWYKRDELGLRLAFFSGGIAASNFLGPLLASGVLIAMEGKLGYAAWRWLFFVEGGLTCILAIVSFYVTPDFPSTPVLWLTADEQMLAQRRMVEDPCDSEQGSAQRSGFVEALTDWRVWWMAIAGSFGLIALSFELYFPTIAATMGYSPTVTLFLCVPPWFLGVITSLLIMRSVLPFMPFPASVILLLCRHSDVTKDRFWHIAGPVCIGVIGFIIAILTMNPSLRYLSLFLMVQSDVSYTVVVAWISNSIPNSSSKLAVAIAFVNVFAISGFMGGSYLWPVEWGPSYSKSFMCCILAFSISLFMFWVYRLHLVRLNEELEKTERALDLPRGFRYIT
ncbi:major facilitator superfamily domain-containing protein [Scleroderma yunnanense]